MDIKAHHRGREAKKEKVGRPLVFSGHKKCAWRPLTLSEHKKYVGASFGFARIQRCFAQMKKNARGVFNLAPAYKKTEAI